MSIDDLYPGESPLVVFISSVMDTELEYARRVATSTIGTPEFLVPWAFEYTPASSESLEDGYLRKVREADLVLWLVGTTTTRPVENEVREAIACNRRLVVIKLPAEHRSPETITLLDSVPGKWSDVKGDLGNWIRLAVNDEITRAMRSKPGMDRIATIEELGRASRARCLERWLAAGVSPDVADELLFSDAGGSWPELDERMSSGLTVLVGDVGAGKSLVAEKQFQSALERFATTASSPLPVFIRFRDLGSSLERAATSASADLGNPRRQGVFLVRRIVSTTPVSGMTCRGAFQSVGCPTHVSATRVGRGSRRPGC